MLIFIGNRHHFDNPVYSYQGVPRMSDQAGVPLNNGQINNLNGLTAKKKPQNWNYYPSEDDDFSNQGNK